MSYGNIVRKLCLWNERLVGILDMASGYFVLLGLQIVCALTQYKQGQMASNDRDTQKSQYHA